MSSMVWRKRRALFFLLACALYVHWTLDKDIREYQPSIAYHSNATATILTPHQEKELPTKQKQFKLFHVLNLYTITTNSSGSSDRHQPYHQWVTLQSIQRAKKHNMPHELDMTLVCAILPSDWGVLPLVVPTCDRTVRLNRSTITEYGTPPQQSLTNTINHSTTANSSSTPEALLLRELFSQQELPFVQDLLDAAVSVARETLDEEEEDKGFYIMLTNSDIGLTENFYEFLVEELEKGRKAFQINRWTIPMEDDESDKDGQNQNQNHTITIRNPTTDPNEIETLFSQIDASIPKGKKHPGDDCFVIHSSIIYEVFLGTLFSGYPPWAHTLKKILKNIVAKDSYEILPSSPQGTFHLGGHGDWNRKPKDASSTNTIAYIKERYQEDIRDCDLHWPVNEYHYHAMNVANCGRVFRERYNITRKWEEGKRNHTSNRGKRRHKEQQQLSSVHTDSNNR